jgi:hypothetical protein
MTLRFLRMGALTLAGVVAACTGNITGPDGPGAGPDGGDTTPDVKDPLVDEAKGHLKFEGTPVHYRVVRLTNEQWTNSVQAVLGLPSPPTNAENFSDTVSGLTDFANNEINLAVDNRAWTDFQKAAESLAGQVAADPAQLSKLYAGTDAAGFISTVGRRAHRRPLTPAEAAQYQKVFDLGAAMSGTQSAFAKGAAAVLEAMLQSPLFLYRNEVGEAGKPLSGYEMAAKLSLWLRNSTPDDALLDAAAGPGKLDTPEGAAAAAAKMLEEPAARAVMRAFHGEFLRFGKFAELNKVGVTGYNNATLNPELAESSFLFFDRIFSQGLGIKDIFLSTVGFVGPNMAKVYGSGVTAPASGFVEHDFGSSRLGYFLQLPFLALNAHNEDPDPIHRGVSISLDVLCAPLGNAAANIPPLPDPKPGQTNRMLVDEHTSGCGTVCHNNMINPLGFAFENFDGMGQYRETETTAGQVLTIDSSGSFTFVGGTKSYANATELMQVIAEDPQAHLCYAKKLASFALQRVVEETELPMLTKLAATSTSGNGSVKQVILDLVKHDSFRIRVGGAQ